MTDTELDTSDTTEVAETTGKTEKRKVVAKKTARKVRFNVLKHISIVFTELKMSHFAPRLENKEFFRSVEYICTYLNVNEAQAFIFCSMFGVYYEVSERPITYFNIADGCECNPLVLLSIRDELEELVDKGIIAECDPPDDSIGRIFYKIPEYVVQSVLANRIIDFDKESATFNIRDFLADVGRIIDNRIDNKLSSMALFDKVERLERRYRGVKEIATIKEHLKDTGDRAMLYDIAFGLVICNNPDLRSFVLINRNTDSGNREAISASIIEETHTLFRKDFIQFEIKGTIQDSTITLTDKAYTLLFGAEGSSFQERKSDKNIILCENIKEKQLFFSKDNEKEIKRLFESVSASSFDNIQSRLEEKGMNKGFCILLYGASGTGKTESVYQMAKSSGRDIFHVDISSMKSEWHGEAEQKTKKLFDRYNRMCENAKKAGDLIPILLFNEADGVFSVRSGVHGAADRSDNSVQNIILEELERFEGILVATTNLSDNLDSAFERRFLFKVKFEKPELAIRVKIWQSNIPRLTKEEAEKLAKEFDFSGGEIANIVRKIMIDEVLTGKETPIKTIRELCSTERLNAKRRGSSLGFTSDDE